MKQRGLSLIEVLVVIAIITILAMIAVPSLSRLIAKSKRTEAYMNLRSLYAAEKAHWAEHNKYSDVLFGSGGVGWQPEGYKGGGSQEQFYYTYGFSGAEGRNHFTGNLQTPSASLAGSQASDKGFTAFAAGDIDNDGKSDILSIDETGKITLVQDDLS